MEFKDLKKQYEANKKNINKAIQDVLNTTHFIQGDSVRELEERLANYVGVNYCITCANGTDALQLALMTWKIGRGDAVFVPDFTFFSSGEIVAAVGAKPFFVDVNQETYNIDVQKLIDSIENVIKEGKYFPKAIIAVDLFGQPADYEKIRKIADQYHLYVLEDGAQGFGGTIDKKKACSFGDISTTSFFPAKPLGCYGDGGAIFTDNGEWACMLRSLAVHGKGQSKYDNVRIGMNSRLDTIQAAVLLAKLPIFIQQELEKSNMLAKFYTQQLQDVVKTPVVKERYVSSWAQYTIQLKNEQERQKLQEYLKSEKIPTAVYYQKPMHRQKAFSEIKYREDDYKITNMLCTRVLSLPFYPYMEHKDAKFIIEKIIGYLKNNGKIFCT